MEIAITGVSSHTDRRMDQIAPIAALPILAASFLGSPHCAGMCGGFVALYAHAARTNHLAHVLYNLGRLTTYLILGISAAQIGATVDAASGIARATAVVVGAGLTIYGAALLLGFSPHTELPIIRAVSQRLAPLAARVLKSSMPCKPFLIGSVTTLLPCGWLYTFVALALASADAAQAAGIMALFWLGTLPIMAGLGVAARTVAGFGAKRFPRLVGALLILGGALSLSSHLDHTHACRHGHEHHHTNHESPPMTAL